MTKRKNPKFDSRLDKQLNAGLDIKGKRKRRTPEQIERARARGENVRDQTGGKRSRRIDGKSAEDRGVDKRFTPARSKLVQVEGDLERAVTHRQNLQEKLENKQSSINREAKRNNNVISQASDREISLIQADLRRAFDKIDNLRSERDSLKRTLR